MKKLGFFISIIFLAFAVIGCNSDADETIECDANQELEDGICVDKNIEEERTECPTGEELVDDACVVIEPEPEITYDYGVYNGDFEFNMQHWEYYSLDGFHDIDSDLSRNGEKSLSIENGDSAYTSIWQSINLDETDGPVAGDFVEFEAYFKGESNIAGTVHLVVENVIDENTKVVLSQSEQTTLTSDWMKITTDIAEIPTDATTINIVMIFETTGAVNVDDITLSKAMSNNADLSMIHIDSTELSDFSTDTLEYTVFLPTEDIPTVSATALRDDSDVSITNATSMTEDTIITVTAADNTVKTYTITFEYAEKTDLAFIKLNGVHLAGFKADRTEYYVMLDDATVPTITYDVFYENTTVTVSDLNEAPGLLTLTVANEDEEKIYTINFDITDDAMYAIPNLGFEDDFDWQTWSQTDNIPDVSNTIVHSGNTSLKTYHQSSVWKEFDFSDTLPNIDDAVKIGAWVYIDSDDPVYDFSVKIIGYTESTNTKDTFVEANIFDDIALNEWVYIESDVDDIGDSDRFQIVFENNSNSDIYVDDVVVIEGISSNANLSQILLDSVALNNFDPNTTEYNYLTDGETIPLATVTPENSNAQVDVIPANEIDGNIVIHVTAVDGTEQTYTINLTVPSNGQLTSIEVDGDPVTEFDALQSNYYVMLPSTTTDFPTVTATPVNSEDTVTVSEGSLPGYATITVTTPEDVNNVYYVYAEVANTDALSTPYPDVNFDKNLENWGLSDPGDVSQTTEQVLNGSHALKMTTGEAWLGFDLAGGDYPSKGNTYSVGMWIYVEGTSTTGFRIRLLEKENNIELINEVMSVTENNRWVYVETEVSADNVSEAAGYLQAVIANETGETVFVDGLRLIEHDPTTSTGDTIYSMPNENLDFETSDDWGFYSPSGTGVDYDTTIARDTQSLKMEEGSAWLGFDLDAAGYPYKGDTVKLGFHVYVDSTTATSVGGFTIKLLEKEGTDPGDTIAITYTTQDQDFAMDEWVYIETTSATITNDPDYLQIVIEEGTDGTVYVDDITVIEINE